MPAIPVTSPGINPVSSASIVTQGRLAISSDGTFNPFFPATFGPSDWGGMPGTWESGLASLQPLSGLVENSPQSLQVPSFSLPSLNFYVYTSPFYFERDENDDSPVNYFPQTSLAFCPVTLSGPDRDVGQPFGLGALGESASVPLTAPIMLFPGVPVSYTLRMPLTRIGIRIFNQSVIRNVLPPPNPQNYTTTTELVYLISVSQ